MQNYVYALFRPFLLFRLFCVLRRSLCGHNKPCGSTGKPCNIGVFWRCDKGDNPYQSSFPANHNPSGVHRCAVAQVVKIPSHVTRHSFCCRSMPTKRVTRRTFFRKPYTSKVGFLPAFCRFSQHAQNRNLDNNFRGHFRHFRGHFRRFY